MKNAFKSFFTLLLLVLSISAVQAQRGEGRDFDPAKRAEQQTSLMVDSLSLSKAQAAKVKEINSKHAQKMQEVRNTNPEGDWSKMRETMEAIRKEQDAELQTVLTIEQFEQWMKIREEMRSKRGSGKGKPDKNPPQEKQG